MTRDPFSVLGISSSSTEDEIKSAYRKLAKQYHPDLNPGNSTAEEKMKEINEAYAEAIRIKKTGEPWNSDTSQRNSERYSHGNQYGNSFYGNDPQFFRWTQNPFSFYSYHPFDTFRNSSQQNNTRFRQRNYLNPELRTVEQHVLAQRFQEALNLLNRIPDQDADWHGLYARADIGMGNRISALDHARKASQMAPWDEEYKLLLQSIEFGWHQYERTKQNKYNLQTAVCNNPFLTCCACNLVCNFFLGGRYFFCC